jgi:hypothetical protein
MDDSRSSSSHELDLVIPIVLECSELLEMVGLYWRQDSDIWMSDREHEVHLTRMIHPIFEDEIARIWHQDTRESKDKNPNPEKWIGSWRTSSDDRERESVFAVVVVERVSDGSFAELMSEEVSDMCRDRRLADSTRDTDDSGTMSQDDEARYESEDLEYESMHGANHRE